MIFNVNFNKNSFFIKHTKAILLLFGLIFYCNADEALNFDNISLSQSKIHLTPNEKAWLDQHKQIKVAAKSSWMPIEFKLENGSHSGVSIDYLKKVANSLSVDIKLVDYSHQMDFTDVDMLSGTGAYLENKNFELLSQPYLIIPYAIYINQDLNKNIDIDGLEDFQGSTVAIFKQGGLAEKIAKDFPSITIVKVNLADEAFDLLKAGKVDAYVGNELVVDYHIEVHRINFTKKVALTPFTTEVYMAANVAQPELHSILEKTLRAIGQNNEVIIKNWKIETKQDHIFLSIITAVIAFTLLALSVRYYLLKRKLKIQNEVNRQKIWHQANFDFLTNLPNRPLLLNRLELAIASANRRRLKVGVLFIDLDNFKHINDSAGHSAGDQLLIEASNRIVSHVREEDTVARFGGDEFMVLLVNLKDLVVIEKICDKILAELAKPFLIQNDQFFISASVGIAVFPDDSDTAEQLISFSDEAMYEAKKNGKNRYKFFSKSIHLESTSRFSIISDLRQAIKKNQLEVYYQPIVDLNSLEVNKFEALVRLNHPVKGLVAPGNFIQVAEESGLIQELGFWVFRQAISDYKFIRDKLKSDIQISINVSPFQFSSPQHMSQLVDLIKESNISGKSFCIEITEGLLLEPTESIINSIELLRKLGVEFSIDDFGTGYSALSYLKKFDIDYLKLDKSFIKNIAVSNDEKILCESIIEMAHKLNIKLVAEGVETLEHKLLLKQLNCDYAQGYYFSKPEPLLKAIESIGLITVAND